MPKKRALPATVTTAALLSVMIGGSMPMALAHHPGPAGTDEPTPSIVGGKPGSTEDHPWMMAISYPDGVPDLPSHQSCGGTLVAPDKVVTAAHCTWDEELGDIEPGALDVIGGRTDMRTEDGEVRDVVDIWVHPDYRLNEPGDPTVMSPADLAVLTLDAPMPYPTLPLADSDDEQLYEPGTETLFMGWGWTSIQDPNSPVLLEANAPTRADADCVAYARQQGYQYDPDDYVCVGNDRGDVHFLGGDSGGPLVIEGQLVGVAAWMPAPDHGGRSMFTRITTYADDLADVLAESGSS